jgi:hypothetical protein
MRHIHPLEPIAVIVLIVVFLYLRKRTAAEKGTRPGPVVPGARAAVTKPAEADPGAEYTALRRRALEVTAESLRLAGTLAEDEPFGMVMEMGISSSIVTLVGLADGDARLYYQTGGGMIGGKDHESVRKAVQEFLAVGRNEVGKMRRITRAPLPLSGKVRFHALTRQGTFTAEVDREALGEPDHDFSPLFYSGQAVVAEMRQVQANRTTPPPSSFPASP